MPTLPDPARTGSHEHREVAESFGGDAARYDRTRPSYPDELVARVCAGLPGRELLDVGVGTGITARQFQAAGCAVLGVEPDERMAAFARRAGTEAEVATFEAWQPEGRTFDAVVAGQAWHWVDPWAGAAKAAEVLRPGGRLALFWNVAQPPAEVTAALAEVYTRVVPDSLVTRGYRADVPALQIYTSQLTKVLDGIRRTAAFDEPEEWRFEWRRDYRRDEWLDQVPTQGDLNLQAPERLAELLAAVGSALDTLGGGFTMSYTTVAITAVRTAQQVTVS